MRDTWSSYPRTCTGLVFSAVVSNMATKLQPVASQTDSIQTNAHQATIDTKLDSTHENEVGYKEYLEGLDMVVSDQESRRVR